MLPSSRRLTTAMFDRVLRDGSSVYGASGTSLFIRILKTGEGKSRFSVVVSKKIAKTAVERNYTRRRTYDALSKILPKIQDGYHGVFFAKVGIQKLTQAQVAAEIDNLLAKTKIFT